VIHATAFSENSDALHWNLNNYFNFAGKRHESFRALENNYDPMKG
jgi:hypothetical protein